MSKRSEWVRNQILTELADGAFHSGETLGEKLSVSRAAVSNHIKALNELGLDIFSVTGKGYKLSRQIDFLNAEKISELLHDDALANIEVLNVIGSTNQHLKDRISELNRGHVCLAEAQTAGRGRHGRKWVSPYGANLYLSMYWPFEGGYQAVNGLSLAIGVAIAEALQRLEVPDVKLKWPNDVYIGKRKLAGVLIEVEGQIGGACDCIVGIGLNVDMQDQDEIDQPWTDLSRTTGERVDRNQLAAELIISLNQSIRQFEMGGLADFQSRWYQFDLYRDVAINLLIGDSVQSGICRGIDANGGLLLEKDGNVRPYYGGEISVRPA